MRASELEGKAVVTVPAMEVVGWIEDVLLHLQWQRVDALVIRSTRFAGSRFVSSRDCRNMGGEAVAISGGGDLENQRHVEEPLQLLSAREAVGREVASISGCIVGELADIFFDPVSRRIVGFEVQGGLFARIFGRARAIEAGDNVRLGRDLLVVPDESLARPRSSTGPSALAAGECSLSRDSWLRGGGPDPRGE